MREGGGAGVLCLSVGRAWATAARTARAESRCCMSESVRRTGVPGRSDKLSPKYGGVEVPSTGDSEVWWWSCSGRSKSPVLHIHFAAPCRTLSPVCSGSCAVPRRALGSLDWRGSIRRVKRVNGGQRCCRALGICWWGFSGRDNLVWGDSRRRRDVIISRCESILADRTWLEIVV